jgi:GTP cyclohydrolase I
MPELKIYEAAEIFGEDVDDNEELPPHITSEIVAKAQALLEAILPDEEWDNSHLKSTGMRFAKSLYELTHSEEFKFSVFPNDLHVNEMIVVKDIPIYSLCAHHLLPFSGKAHVGYIPDARIAGLSKLPRMVEYWMRGLWVQEHLNDAITKHLEEYLEPQGVAVIIEAEHLCMTMRGVRTPGAKTTTSSMTGVFMDHSRLARQEFLDLISKNGHK